MNVLICFSIIFITILSSTAFARNLVPAEILFESTENPDITKRVIRFLRTEVREDNSPVTYEGGFTGADYKLNPLTGRMVEIPFPVDEAGNGDCWPTTYELSLKIILSKIHCDNDGYAEGGNTGVIATYNEESSTFHIISYLKNRPQDGQNWTKDFGNKFIVKKIIWD